LLATRRAGTPSARHDGLGRLRVSRRNAVRCRTKRIANRRSAHHFCRTAPGSIEAVVERDPRVHRNALAPEAARRTPLTMRHVVVMVTTSYPRFPGDSVGTFMEPIARSVAARGHEVHVVAPWHPLVTRPSEEHGIRFHFYRYAPLRSLNVFG